jgi:hypothetical protein
MSVTEQDVLQEAILKFHDEPPHSRARREIIDDTVVQLRSIIPENGDYWSAKRVRTWFCNHRADVPTLKRKLNTDGESPIPEKRRKLSNSDVGIPKLDERPKLAETKHLRTTSKSHEQIPKVPETVRRTSTGSQKLLPLKRRDIYSKRTNPKPETKISVPESDIFPIMAHCFQIYSCRAIGPDKNPREPWQTSTHGYIILNFDDRTGKVTWKHDQQFSAFSGKLLNPAAVSTRLSSNWTTYQMLGKIGTSIMNQRKLNVSKKHSFSCYFRLLSKENIHPLLDKLNEIRERDISNFGENSSNTDEAWEKFLPQIGDLEAKFQFYSSNNKICGARVFARPFKVFKNASDPPSIVELKYVLKSLQVGLKLLRQTELENQPDAASKVFDGQMANQPPSIVSLQAPTSSQLVR